MKQRTIRRLSILCVTLLFAGCLGEDASTAVNEAASESDSAAAEPVQPVPLQLASWSEVEQLIAEHKGKVVVLDVWSTWCTPCVREFPNLVELHRRWGDRVVCMSLNCNYTGAEGESPEDARPDVEAFLQQQGAAFPNVISTTPDLELFDKLGAAAIPVVRVYDRSGQLQKQFTNDSGEYGEEGFTYEAHIEPLVQQLLEE